MSDAGEKQTTILAARIVTPRGEIRRGAVRLAGRRIVFVGKEDDLPSSDPRSHVGDILIPGMIDLHLNGAAGVDLAEDRSDGLSKVGATLARHGCTGYLATVITDRRERLLGSLKSLARRLGEPARGARALGIHLEGPFINPAMKGAHHEDCIQPPSAAAFEEYLEASSGRLKMLTLAPEMDSALDLIETARRRLPIVAVGHSLADWECGREAIARGANVAVHVFNAMAPLHHRRPGIVAAILNSAEIAAEIIADGVHVHPEMIRVLFRCKGPSRVVLVTDAVSAAGMPDGRYRVGGVEIRKIDGVCRDARGSLAGSALQMDAGLRNLWRWLGGDGVSLGDLVRGACELPAALLGMGEKGGVETGRDADLVLLDEQLQVTKTWVEGQLVYDRSTG